MADRVIRAVFLFPNGNIAVCDQYGEQMPDYQTPASGPDIARDAPDDGTVEWNGCTRESLMPPLQPGQCPAYREHGLNCGEREGHEGNHHNEGPFAEPTT